MADEESYRLPGHARPRRYELELVPDLGRASFGGRAVISVDLPEPARALVLNSADLTIGAARVDTPGGERIQPEVRLDPDDQRLTVELGREVPAGEGYLLTLEFEGVLNDQLRGFYRSTFRDGDGNERVIATTQFEATDARRAFPCWDEPEYKAVFSVTLVVEEGLTGLSNGPLLSSSRRADGRVELRFADTMVMSTYLVAFVVGAYQLTDPVDVDGVPVRVATVPGKLGLAGYAMEAAVHSVRFLRGYFGIPYPGGKLDHVAVPDFAFGAMENLGCVTYRESLLLADPATAAQTELQRIATVVAHETAHMWFGDLVTMKWWNGIWLNEAFATFMELTTTDAFRPEWQVWTAFGAGRAAAMGTDGLHATRPVEFPVGRPDEAEGMFDVLTYQKGGSVLRMLEQYLGPEVFRKGISHYLATHAYGNTETTDLWDALEAMSGEPVRSIMGSWIYQGGYPMITAAVGSDPATVVLTQRRFVYQGDPDDSSWAVPVNLRASVGGVVHHERVLLDGREGSCTFPGPVEWVVVNDGAWGFYRTRYSGELGRRLTDAGLPAVLNALERLQLVGDIWAAVVSADAGLEEWATVATAVAAEPDPDLWGSIGAVLHMLDLIGDEGDQEAVGRMCRRLARPVWEAIGWDPAPGEGERVATARSRVLSALAETGRDPEVAAQAVERFRAHLDGSGPAVTPDLIATVARIAVASGGSQAWSDAFGAYRRAELPQDQLRYLYALAETPDEDLRGRTLDMMLGPDVRSQDAPFVVAAVMGRRDGAAPAWGWVQEHWDRITERFPPSLLIRVLEATAAFVDWRLAGDVHRFFDSHEIPVSAIRTSQILERMDVNVALARRLRGSIASALEPGAPPG